MSYLLLQNNQTGEIFQLDTPFDQADYVAALEKIEIQTSRDKWLAGEGIIDLEIVEIITDTPVQDLMRMCNNPVLINMAESMYMDAQNKYNVDAYLEIIGGINDIFDFCNLCLQSDDVYYVSYDNGYGYEGYGNYLLEYRDDEIPDWILPYIDAESYGRDMAQGGDDYIGDYGFINEYDCDVDIEQYDKEELLVDEFEWQIELNDDKLADLGEQIYVREHKTPEPLPSAAWTPKEMSFESLIQIL